MEPEAGTLVAFAAKHGQEALDGEGKDSPFAIALAKRMQTPNLDVRRLFDLVRDDVMASTNGKQQPFSYGSLSGSQDFYFVQKKETIGASSITPDDCVRGSPSLRTKACRWA